MRKRIKQLWNFPENARSPSLFKPGPGKGPMRVNRGRSDLEIASFAASIKLILVRGDSGLSRFGHRAITLMARGEGE